MKGKVNMRLGKLTIKVKKKLEDYTYYIGSNRKASDYKTTMEFIMNHIITEYSVGNDIAEIIWKMRYIDTEEGYPVLKVSYATSTREKRTLQNRPQRGIRCCHKTQDNLPRQKNEILCLDLVSLNPSQDLNQQRKNWNLTLVDQSNSPNL